MKNVELSSDDLKVIEALIQTWDDNDAPLPGGITYAMAFETFKKFGFEPPSQTTLMIQRIESTVLDRGRFGAFYDRFK
jgi:hypothetical protein